MENKKFLDLNINTKQSKTERPWGSYEILCKGTGYQSKRLTINSGQRLSLQTHKHRDEQWVIAKGTAKVTIDNMVKSTELIIEVLCLLIFMDLVITIISRIHM